MTVGEPRDQWAKSFVTDALEQGKQLGHQDIELCFLRKLHELMQQKLSYMNMDDRAYTMKITQIEAEIKGCEYGLLLMQSYNLRKNVS